MFIKDLVAFVFWAPDPLILDFDKKSFDSRVWSAKIKGTQTFRNVVF